MICIFICFIFIFFSIMIYEAFEYSPLCYTIGACILLLYKKEFESANLKPLFYPSPNLFPLW